MPRKRRVEKRLRTPRLAWSVAALAALANGRAEWEAYWTGPDQARQAWAFLRRDEETADYDAMWREHEARPDPRVSAD